MKTQPNFEVSFDLLLYHDYLLYFIMIIPCRKDRDLAAEQQYIAIYYIVVLQLSCGLLGMS